MSKYITQALLILFGTALGFGLNQITYGQKIATELSTISLQVKNNSKDIEYIKETDQRLDKDITQARTDFTARLLTLVNELHTHMDIEKEVLSFLKTTVDGSQKQILQNDALIKQNADLLRQLAVKKGTQ